MPPASRDVYDKLANEWYVKVEHADLTDSDEGTRTCTICLNDNQPPCFMTRLPCNHCFDYDCIQQWLRTQNFCPNCNQKVSSDVNGMRRFLNELDFLGERIQEAAGNGLFQLGMLGLMGAAYTLASVGEFVQDVVTAANEVPVIRANRNVPQEHVSTRPGFQVSLHERFFYPNEFPITPDLTELEIEDLEFLQVYVKKQLLDDSTWRELEHPTNFLQLIRYLKDPNNRNKPMLHKLKWIIRQLRVVHLLPLSQIRLQEIPAYSLLGLRKRMYYLCHCICWLPKICCSLLLDLCLIPWIPLLYLYFLFLNSVINELFCTNTEEADVSDFCCLFTRDLTMDMRSNRKDRFREYIIENNLDSGRNEHIERIARWSERVPGEVALGRVRGRILQIDADNQV